MSKTLLRNLTSAPLPLPFPFRGILPAGGGVVVDAPIATVRSALGAAARLSNVGLDLSEVDSTPSDAFYLGNLLDPVATSAATAAAIAASNLVARPGRVRLTGLDGSTSPNMVLLAAPHQAGLYLWSTELDKTVAATAGTVTCTLNYTHPEGGARTKARTALSLIGTGGFSIGVFGFESNGLVAVSVDNACAGVTGGPPVFSLAHAATLAG